MAIDEWVPVERELLDQALQIRGGCLKAKLTKAFPTLHSSSLSTPLFFLSPSHTTNTHTHTYTCTHTHTSINNAQQNLIFVTDLHDLLHSVLPSLSFCFVLWQRMMSHPLRDTCIIQLLYNVIENSVHVSEKIRRKDERSKEGQANNMIEQHYTPKTDT